MSSSLVRGRRAVGTGVSAAPAEMSGVDLDDARDLGRTLLRQHGLGEWSLVFDRAKRRAGSCRYADRTLTLSTPLTLLYDEAEVRDTLLHEIAHALAGPQHGHDEVWRATARRVGCSAQRCVSPDAPRVPGDWQGRCPQGHTAERYRRPTRLLLCSRCRQRPVPERVLEWTFRGSTVPMHPSYAAELAALAGPRVDDAAPSFATGDEVRIELGRRFRGRVGRVVKVGRTRAHVQLAEGVLTVPFPGLSRLDPGSA